jgi:hypothetical protein
MMDRKRKLCQQSRTTKFDCGGNLEMDCDEGEMNGILAWHKCEWAI